jgi:hypothetical protein
MTMLETRLNNQWNHDDFDLFSTDNQQAVKGLHLTSRDSPLALISSILTL